ncbi:heme ABC exporter ATP-binding protein CcmA, partial [bacterium]
MNAAPPVSGPAPGVWADGVVCRFGPLTALDRVDLAAPPGRITVVVGPNGAGKTTLLRVVATLVRPEGGTVHVAGADALRAPAAVRARIGVVMHRPLLYPDLTLAENLAFYARLYGLDEPAARVEVALAAAELTAFARRPVRTLSRGMAQRAAIARAVLHDPAVLLLDEPYTGLDPRSADRLDRALAAHAAAGRAVVITLHDLDRAAALAGPLVVLRRGAVAWAGEAAG